MLWIKGFGVFCDEDEDDVRDICGSVVWCGVVCCVLLISCSVVVCWCCSCGGGVVSVW